MRKWKLRRAVLELILECSRENHPKEFAGFLRAEKDIISELILIPGTLSGKRSALLRLHMLPIDFTIVGTVHSHPTSGINPSEQDLGFFTRFRGLHLIVAYPYNQDCWKVYNSKGIEIQLELVD
jgi:proteasome lid subunit RPN8/RPN11